MYAGNYGEEIHAANVTLPLFYARFDYKNVVNKIFGINQVGECYVTTHLQN